MMLAPGERPGDIFSSSWNIEGFEIPGEKSYLITDPR